MERQRRQRNLEVGKLRKVQGRPINVSTHSFCLWLRKAMKEVRNALFTESPAEAQDPCDAKFSAVRFVCNMVETHCEA